MIDGHDDHVAAPSQVFAIGAAVISFNDFEIRIISGDDVAPRATSPRAPGEVGRRSNPVAVSDFELGNIPTHMATSRNR